MDLYIANCSKQPHDFHYWVPEGRRPFSRTVQPGSQIKLEFATRDVVDHVLSQHEAYGITDARELKAGQPFSGMAYSVDKPLNVDEITAGLGYRDDTMIEAATDARKVQAVVNDAVLAETALRTGSKLLHSEVEVIEQSKGPGDTDEKFTQRVAVETASRQPRGAARAR